MIYCAYPKAQFESHEQEIREVLEDFLSKGSYILGEQVQNFEKEFCAYLGVDYGIGVANGTEAITIGLKALGVGVGDEVITVSHTAVATVVGIEQTGATAVLADIDPEFYTIDVSKLDKLLTPRTKAIVVVHLYGQSCDLDAIMAFCKSRRLALLEDCAQAHGASWKDKRVGSYGDVSTFSFYPTKNLGALGDGGFVATNSPKVYDSLKILRQYGWRERYVSEIRGMNSRLDEIQAGILRVKLKYLDKDNARRQNIAEMYNSSFEGLPLVIPKVHPFSKHVFHLYVIKTEKRDALIEHLNSSNIYPLIHYPVPIHQQPAYLGSCEKGSLPVTEAIASQVLSLPMYPELSASEQEVIVRTVKSFF